MNPRKQWFTILIAGITIVLGVWLFTLFASGLWLHDAPGYPWSIVFTGVWVALLGLGVALAGFRAARDTPVLIRGMSVIGAGIFAVSILMNVFNLIGRTSNHSVSITASSWLVFLGLILSTVGHLLETGWGKTNRRAWLRVIAAALIGAIVLIGIIVGWTLLF